VRAGAVTVDGRLTSQTEALTQPERGPAAVLDTLRATVASLASGLTDLACIGVASAGQIDPETGAVVQAANLGWRNVPLAASLESTFGVPVTVENDVRAAAWGEFRFGVHRGVGSLLAVFVGTGVGSGAVLDGRLWRGAGNAAGELGHTQVVADGHLCACGARGCLEQYVSGNGFRRRLRDALQARVPTRLAELTDGDPDALDATTVAAAANSGDEFSRALWSDATRHLTQAVANAVTLLNPRVLVLGGGLFEALPELFDGVAGGILKATTELARSSLAVERARLGDWAGVLGAAALAASEGGFAPLPSVVAR
jgi:glucokinase